MTDTTYTPSITFNQPAPFRQNHKRIDSNKKTAVTGDLPGVNRARDNFPLQTALLGLCQDGLPVLFDLADSRPGPLLILGNTGSGKARLQQQIVSSLMHNNTSEHFQFSVISSHPKWRELINKAKQEKYWIDLSGENTAEPGEQIIRAAELAERKYMQNQEDLAILILVDDLSFIFHQDAEVQLNFEWLCKNGPQVKVWLVASLETQAALSMGRWIRYFRTRILGEMPEKVSNRLGLYEYSHAESLIPGTEFAVFINDSWLKFHLPGISNRSGER